MDCKLKTVANPSEVAFGHRDKGGTGTVLCGHGWRRLSSDHVLSPSLDAAVGRNGCLWNMGRKDHLEKYEKASHTKNIELA